jgi:hypothetical protein
MGRRYLPKNILKINKMLWSILKLRNSWLVVWRGKQRLKKLKSILRSGKRLKNWRKIGKETCSQ